MPWRTSEKTHNPRPDSQESDAGYWRWKLSQALKRSDVFHWRLFALVHTDFGMSGDTQANIVLMFLVLSLWYQLYKIQFALKKIPVMGCEGKIFIFFRQAQKERKQDEREKLKEL